MLSRGYKWLVLCSFMFGNSQFWPYIRSLHQFGTEGAGVGASGAYLTTNFSTGYSLVGANRWYWWYVSAIHLYYRVVLKNLDLGFPLFWCSPFRPLFVSYGVILSSLISHIARYAPSSTYKSTSENRTKVNTT